MPRNIAVGQSTSVRGRGVRPTVAQAESTRELDGLLINYAVENNLSNAHSRTMASVKKTLHTRMAQMGVSRHTARVNLPDGRSADFEAVIDAPEQEVISVEMLKELVDADTFMKIIKATKTAVTEHAGTNVAIRCTVMETAKEDLRIKEVK